MHALEIETKFLEIDVAQICNQLNDKGAKLIYDGRITAKYYDTVQRDLKKKGASLRLRLKEATGEIDFTYKHKKSEAVVRQCDEIEVPVGSADTLMGKVLFNHTDSILRNTGYEPFRCIEKNRKTFIMDNVRFELDSILKVDGVEFVIPTLLEIEAMSAEMVLNYAGLLGLKKEDSKPWSTRRTIKYYRNKLEK